jgi:hypothetical protein
MATPPADEPRAPAIGGPMSEHDADARLDILFCDGVFAIALTLLVIGHQRKEAASSSPVHGLIEEGEAFRRLGIGT